MMLTLIMEGLFLYLDPLDQGCILFCDSDLYVHTCSWVDSHCGICEGWLYSEGGADPVFPAHHSGSVRD